MATSTQIETWISEVEAQRQKVALGQAYIEIMRDGRRVQVEVTGLNDLNNYLQTLRSELVEAQVSEGVSPTRRRSAISIAWGN